MNIAVVGTGYVGLVTGTCFAESGNQVICVDNNKEKVKKLKNGQVPIYEPGLEDIFVRNINEGRLSFTASLEKAVKDANVIFLALPTPEMEDGSADLSYVLGVAEKLGKYLNDYVVIVNKSTVPVGTARKVTKKIFSVTPGLKFNVVSNPEFLREGQAIDDFMKPERIVVGSKSKKAVEIMRELYGPFIQRNPDCFMVMDEESAEMVKYAANAMLATRISFMNEIARICEAVGADVNHVRAGIGSDSRIGSQFLYSGPGYGGSCFPKDVLALDRVAKSMNVDVCILETVDKINDKQKLILPDKIRKYYKNNIKSKKFALWGLAFKDNTDDVRESPSLTLLHELTKDGAEIIAYDPKAIDNTKREIGNNLMVSYKLDQYEVLSNCDALIIMTNWKEFSSPDFDKIKSLLNNPIIFDGRNMYDLKKMESEGFSYLSIGRKGVKSGK